LATINKLHTPSRKEDLHSRLIRKKRSPIGGETERAPAGVAANALPGGPAVELKSATCWSAAMDQAGHLGLVQSQYLIIAQLSEYMLLLVHSSRKLSCKSLR
jgi:hypothetical protein